MAHRKDWIGLVFRAYWLYRVIRDSQAAAVRALEMAPDRMLRPYIEDTIQRDSEVDNEQRHRYRGLEYSTV